MQAYGSVPTTQAPTLQERLEALEDAFREVKAAKGIQGPRGPAGPIDAAVDQATKAVNQVVREAEARVQAEATEAFKKFTAEITKLEDFAVALRRDFLDQQKQLREIIQNTVDNTVVKTLHEYHLLDANGEPAHWRSSRLS